LTESAGLLDGLTFRVKTPPADLEKLPALVFLVGLVSKLISLATAGDSTEGTIRDYVTGLTSSQLLYAATLMDATGLLTAVGPFGRRRRGLAFVSIGCVFCLYHLFAFVFWNKPNCNCLSALSSFFGAPQQVLAVIASVFSVYLFLRGFVLLGPTAHAKVKATFDRMECAIGRRSIGRWLPITMLILIVVAIVAYLSAVAPIGTALEFDGDEQLELFKASLLTEGHQLYTDTWDDQPPLLTYIYAGLMKIWGRGVLGPRCFSLACLVLVLCSTGLHLQRTHGSLASLLFVFTFPVLPEVIKIGLSATQEMPMIAFSMLAVIYCAAPSFRKID
jgi:hypothetical protein